MEATDDYPLNIKTLEEIKNKFAFKDIESIYKACGSLGITEEDKEELLDQNYYSLNLFCIQNKEIKNNLIEEVWFSIENDINRIISFIKERYDLYIFNKKLFPELIKEPIQRSFYFNFKINYQDGKSFKFRIIEEITHNSETQNDEVVIYINGYFDSETNKWNCFKIKLTPQNNYEDTLIGKSESYGEIDMRIN
jgi:hypothetical protein